MKEELKREAEEIRTLYNSGVITREEAKKRIKPYAEYYNQRAKEIADKYNQRPMKFSFVGFMR